MQQPARPSLHQTLVGDGEPTCCERGLVAQVGLPSKAMLTIYVVALAALMASLPRSAAHFQV